MGYSNLLEKPGRLVLAKEHQAAYQWVQNNGRGYLQLPLLNHPAAFHLFGTRLLPQSEIQNRYQAIQVRQVHGDQIHSVTEDSNPFTEKETEGDGLITNLPKRFIAISSADCTPVLLFDPVKKVVGAVHAGWRGSLLNITGKAVDKMVSCHGSDPVNLLAGIGPTINACCFEVEGDVADKIDRETPYGDYVLQKKKPQEGTAKWRLDLVMLNRLQLIDAGLPPAQIESAGLCTSCLPNLFYSFRRDQRKVGNMVSGIMLL